MLCAPLTTSFLPREKEVSMRAIRESARIGWILCAGVVGVLGLLCQGSAGAEVLNPLTLTKYMDPLPLPGVAQPAAPNYYEIGAWQIQQQLHSQLPPTTVYAYGTSPGTASYPGPTIVAQKGVPIQIKWTNHLGMTHILSYAFDPTIPRAVTTTGVPIATHVHGAEVEPQSDGGPMTWFTPDFAETGPDYAGPVKTYVNTQLPTTLWYHDHAFGYTRHNVYAGLAGFYILTDPGHEPANLPSGPYELGMAIQDRMFTTDGQLWYPNVGETPEHPVWIPEFFGDVMLVNGKIWPYLNVEPRKYRFRILNGCNARFLSIGLADRITSAPGPAFYQIGTDGGYLSEPVLLNDPNDAHSPRLLLAPAERADVIIDFSGYAPGTEFILKNTAKAPYPTGDVPDPKTTGQIMLFRVVSSTGPDLSEIPAQLATVERLSNPTLHRTMTLNEKEGLTGPDMAMINGLRMDAPATEFPTLGTTEMWEIVNMTEDAHPIHIHLVQFQLLNRQKYNLARYEKAFAAVNDLSGESYTPVDVSPYLRGKPVPADANERGWKDTFRMNPGEVTRILVRFAPQDDSPAYTFDATAEPGYVWHCHILEHEENDMMRPFHPVAAPPAPLAGVLETTPPAVTTEGPSVWATFPNPVSASSNVRFNLRTAGSVTVDLYNVSGERVHRLVNGWFGAGEHSVPWTRTAENGQRLGAGMYFMHFQADGVLRTQKVVLTQ
jgi:spore coat protein A, manganese oxidase